MTRTGTLIALSTNGEEEKRFKNLETLIGRREGERRKGMGGTRKIG